MKKLFYALMAMATLSFVACDRNEKPGNGDDNKQDTIPVVNDDLPTVEPVDGKCVIVWHCAEFTPSIENQLVFAGNYNSYNTAVDQLAKFQAIDGWKEWYKVEIDVAAVDTLMGKPCALYLDGTFPSSWDYQWVSTEAHPCTILQGEAEIEVEFEVDSKLVVPAASGKAVYVESSAFKGGDPNKEPDTFKVSVTCIVEKPVTEGGIVCIVGAFNEWNEKSAPELASTDGGKTWTGVVEGVVMNTEYKYVVNHDWANEQCTKDPDSEYGLKAANCKFNDIEVEDSFYGFFNFGVEKKPEE